MRFQVEWKLPQGIPTTTYVNFIFKHSYGIEFRDGNSNYIIPWNQVMYIHENLTEPKESVIVKE